VSGKSIDECGRLLLRQSEVGREWSAQGLQVLAARQCVREVGGRQRTTVPAKVMQPGSVVAHDRDQPELRR